MVWGISISLYLFLAGLGAGAFALSAYWAHTDPDARAARLIGRVVAPVAVGIGLLLLMFDAEAGFHNPLRFFNLLNNFSSVMTWGVVILSLFMVTSLIALGLDLAKKRVPVALDGVGVILAVAVAVYTGVLLGAAQTAVPLWNGIVLPVLFAVSAASAGIAAVVLIASLALRRPLPNGALVDKAQVALPLAELVLIVALLAVANFAGVAGQAATNSLLGGTYAFAFWGGLVFIGLVVPFALDVTLARSAKKQPSVDASNGAPQAKVATSPLAASLVAAVCVLIGGIALRYLVIAAAVPVSFGA